MDGLKTRGTKDAQAAGNIQSLHSTFTDKLSVLVLAGGPSAEREVSLLSGAAVVQALTERGHEVTQADITPEDLSALETDDYQVVFPVLHGTFGEDGQLQRILEQRGIPYVGSDAASSQLAMDKYRSKQAFVRAGLDTPRSVLIEKSLPASPVKAEQISAALDHVGLPCVVKPNCQGSSIGVVIAPDEKTTHRAVADSLAKYGDCLVEQFVRGWEFTVGILAGQALPMIEIQTAREFYDYDAKYLDDDTRYLFEIDLSQDRLQAVQADARRAFDALGCRDYARVDMILTASHRDHILEVNTIPGFTSHSLVPKAGAHAGMDLGAICERIVQMALNR